MKRLTRLALVCLMILCMVPAWHFAAAEESEFWGFLHV